MSSHRARRIDRETAEQLLRGAPAGAPRPLADLLAAAAAPAHAGELAGEQAALAAFREAQLVPAAEPMRQSTLAKLFTVKVAALTIAFSALGGVAVAAGTGALPTPSEDKPPAVRPTPSYTTEPPAAEGAGAPTSPKPPPTPTKSKGNAPKGTPTPSTVGLCTAYTAMAPGRRAKALRSPAFAALVKAAGGKGNVAAYCTTVLAGEASTSPEQPGTGKRPRPGSGQTGEEQEEPAPTPQLSAN